MTMSKQEEDDLRRELKELKEERRKSDEEHKKETTLMLREIKDSLDETCGNVNNLAHEQTICNRNVGRLQTEMVEIQHTVNGKPSQPETGLNMRVAMIEKTGQFSSKFWWLVGGAGVAAVFKFAFDLIK